MMEELIIIGFGIISGTISYLLTELIRLRRELRESRKAMEEQDEFLRLELNILKKKIKV